MRFKKRPWTQEQEELIAEAIEQAILNLQRFDPLHPRALERLLQDQGYGKKITVQDDESEESGSASLASLAMWRLCDKKKIRFISQKTFRLDGSPVANEQDMQQ